MFDRVLSIFIFCLILVAMVLRLSHPGLLFFNLDEGLLFNMVDQARSTGVWPTHGLAGTKGVVYGPVPVSIYLTLSHLLSDLRDLPTVAFYFNGLLQLATLIYMLTGLAKIASRRTALLVAGLVFCSPHLLLYSRSVWDNSFLICCTNTFAGFAFRDLSAKKEKIRTKRNQLAVWVGIGILSALTIGIHLMALPLVATMMIYGLYRSSSRRNAIVGLGLSVSLVLCLLWPYFMAMVHWPREGGVSGAYKISKVLTGTRGIFAEWSGWISWSEFARYFAGAKMDNLFQEMGLTSKVSIIFPITLSRVMQLFWASIFVTAPYFLLLRRPRVPLTFILWVLVVGMTFLLFGHYSMALIKDATTHPHYFQPVWWLPFAFFAIWLDHVPKPLLKAIATTVCIVIILLNSAMNLLFANVVRRDAGFASSHFGPSIDSLWDAARDLCQRDSSDRLALDDQSPILPMSTSLWIFRHSENCTGKTIETANQGPRYTPQYQALSGARIEWQRIE